MLKVEGRGAGVRLTPPPLMPSCDFFYLMPSRVKMVTNNFVYWSDGLEGRAFDHHSRNGGRGICQQKLPAGPGI